MKIQWDYSGRIYFNLHFKQRKNSLSVCDLFLFGCWRFMGKTVCYLREKGLFVCWKIGTLCVFKIVIDWSMRILLENWFLRLMGKLFSEFSLLGIRWRLEKEDIKGLPHKILQIESSACCIRGLCINYATLTLNYLLLSNFAMKSCGTGWLSRTWKKKTFHLLNFNSYEWLHTVTDENRKQIAKIIALVRVLQSFNH